MSKPKNKILLAIDICVNPYEYGPEDISDNAPYIISLGKNGLKMSELDQYLLTHTTLGEEISPMSDMHTDEPLTAERKNSLGYRLLNKLFRDCFPELRR
jgi:hypothetical protein